MRLPHSCARPAHRSRGCSSPATSPGLVLLFGAIVAIGRALYQTWLGVAMLAALMTLRHRITQTGANSLESYFQPRMIAFALGAWAIAAYLRGRGAAGAGAGGRRVRHSSDHGDVVRDMDRRGVARLRARVARASRRRSRRLAHALRSGPSRSARCAAIWIAWIRSGPRQWRARITSFLPT